MGECAKQVPRLLLHRLSVGDERHPYRCYTSDLRKTRHVVGLVCVLFQGLFDKGQGIVIHCSEDAASSARASVSGKGVHANADTCSA